jgi:hypothetical protein
MKDETKVAFGITGFLFVVAIIWVELLCTSYACPDLKHIGLPWTFHLFFVPTYKTALGYPWTILSVLLNAYIVFAIIYRLVRK